MKLLRSSPVLEEIHYQIILYRSSFACLNQFEEHFLVGRKATKSVQHFEGEDQYRTIISIAKSSIVIQDRDGCQWICHGSSIDEIS
jgi:hypothetical protein